jgi:SAM-dependent methyltransferase
VSVTEPPNHHADFPGFSGLFGLIAGLSMVTGRGAVARLAADLARVAAADRVVDVGCGPGAAAREAARRGARSGASIPHR